MIKSSFTPPKYKTAIFLVLALLVLYVISRHNYLLFHSLVDGVSIIIAACVFAIIWNGRRIVDNDYFLYIGIALLFFAFWDFMHLLGNKNMGVFPQYGNLGPALYIVSRYILSISFIIAPLFINRKLNTTLMYASYSLLTLLILLSIFSWQIFPVCIVEGVGLTPFKVVSDYIICLILLGAIGRLLINRRSFDSRVLRLIVSSIILSIATGLAFTLYADPFGIMNTLGHFCQIASFYLIYLAFIETSLTKPQDILYQKLKQNEGKLAENVKNLNDANAELQQEIVERKRVEKALRESESRYRHSIALTGQIGWATRADGLIEDVTAWRKYTGQSVEEVKGWGWVNALHPDDKKHAAQVWKEAVDSKSNYETEYRVRRHDGVYRHFIARGIPILNDEGIIQQWVGTCIDITERKNIEEALEEERRRLQQALDEVRTLRGIVPICANCKKIRDDKGYWNQVEQYISRHTDAQFSHGICPDCAQQLYPEFYIKGLS
jgi:PAS domain S-box-containing protein